MGTLLMDQWPPEQVVIPTLSEQSLNETKPAEKETWLFQIETALFLAKKISQLKTKAQFFW